MDRAGLPAEIATRTREIVVSTRSGDRTGAAAHPPAVTPVLRRVDTPPPSGGCRIFAVATSEAFGLSRLELNAAAACVTYVGASQLGETAATVAALREARAPPCRLIRRRGRTWS
jgi:DNA mismatch repair protein MutS